MIKLVISEVIQACQGTIAGDMPAFSVAGVSTDTRTVAPGELFFALHGPNFDGHNFVAAALQRGACGAVIAAERTADILKAVEGSGATPLLVRVDDPLAALGRLAAFHRRQSSARVIAVAGSNGKTTTKSLIEHILRGSLRGRASQKSFNNAIGVPLTLLSAEMGDEFLVVEIGTNAPGEIAALAAVAQPDIAVITCIGEEHLEGLGDLAGVAREECAILAHVKRGGFAAVNIDWPGIREHLPLGRGVTIATFGGAESGADLRVTNPRVADGRLSFQLNGRLDLRLPTINVCNASNAVAAVAVARRMGLRDEEITARLESFSPPPMRSEVQTVGGVTLVNDAYNANPHSMRAAIETLAALPAKRRVFVAGEMRELGRSSAAMHADIATRLANDGRIDQIVTVGDAAVLMNAGLRNASAAVQAVADPLAAAAHLANWVAPGDAVLFKASRAVGLEAAVKALGERLVQRGPAPASNDVSDSLFGAVGAQG